MASVIPHIAIPALIFLILWLVWPLLMAVFEIYQNRKRLSKIFPSPPYHWFWGHSTADGLNHTMLMNIVEWMKTFSTCFALHLGPLRSTLLVCHPSTVKDILRINEDKYYGPGPSFYSMSRPIIGDGLLNSAGSKWFVNRRLLTPAFHFGILKGYFKVFNDTAKKFCKGLCMNPDTTTGIEIFQTVSYCTMSTLLRCAFSRDEDLPLVGDNAAYFKLLDRAIKIMAKRAHTPWLYPSVIFNNTALGKEYYHTCKMLKDVAMVIIKERAEALRENPDIIQEKLHLDFLDILLLAKDEEGNPLTADAISDEVRTFLFAGYDTTESAIGFMLYNLANNPEIQTKAQAELDQLFDDKDSDDITLNDISQLPYLTMCVKESLRMFPPANLTFRKTSRTMVIDKKEVPKDSFITISNWAAHHNASVWGNDHMTYNPERFSEENIIKMEPHAFIPFSAGPRNCIGQNFALNEIKVFIAQVLRHFCVKVHPETRLDLAYEVVLKNRGGIKLCFQERSVEYIQK